MLPIMMVLPLLIADYNKGSLVTRSKMFRSLTAVAAVIGLTVPVLGANPIIAQVATQVAQVFNLPLVTAGIIVLVNRKEMGAHRGGVLLNAGLAAALIFSLVMSYVAVIGLKDFF
jgi:hypothetical protein